MYQVQLTLNLGLFIREGIVTPSRLKFPRGFQNFYHYQLSIVHYITVDYRLKKDLLMHNFTRTLSHELIYHENIPRIAKIKKPNNKIC